MNQILLSNTIIWLEGFFHYHPLYDSIGLQFPNIYNYKKSYNPQYDNIRIFENIENNLPKECIILLKKTITCSICNKKTNNKIYSFRNLFWPGIYIHLLEYHNVQASINFATFLEKYQMCLMTKCNILQSLTEFKLKFIGTIIKQPNLEKYIRLTTNQINIMDALMYYGGNTKKYLKNSNTLYSEHFGILNFESFNLSSIIISAKEGRIDKDDPSIFLPSDHYILEDYEYFFHTHPPTPKPGGRILDGILYEYPSINDIFHFIEHHKKGITIGSIIIATEGFYLIRPLDFKKPILEPPERQLTKLFDTVQEEAIKLYGTKFSETYFYEVISRNTKGINYINKYLSKYNI